MIIERSDYDVAAWIADLINILKKRGFLMKKEDAWLVVQENLVEFIELYEGGASPHEAFEDYLGEDK
jgi:hypothetical protein